MTLNTALQVAEIAPVAGTIAFAMLAALALAARPRREARPLPIPAETPKGGPR